MTSLWPHSWFVTKQGQNVHTDLFTDYVQRLANYGPQAKSGLPPIFVNRILLEQWHSHSFTYSLWFSCYNAEWIVVTETIWLAMPKIFTIGHLRKSLWTPDQEEQFQNSNSFSELSSIFFLLIWQWKSQPTNNVRHFLPWVLYPKSYTVSQVRCQC